MSSIQCIFRCYRFIDSYLGNSNPSLCRFWWSYPRLGTLWSHRDNIWGKNWFSNSHRPNNHPHLSYKSNNPLSEWWRLNNCPYRSVHNQDNIIVEWDRCYNCYCISRISIKNNCRILRPRIERYIGYKFAWRYRNNIVLEWFHQNNISCIYSNPNYLLNKLPHYQLLIPHSALSRSYLSMFHWDLSQYLHNTSRSINKSSHSHITHSYCNHPFSRNLLR